MRCGSSSFSIHLTDDLTNQDAVVPHTDVGTSALSAGLLSSGVNMRIRTGFTLGLLAGLLGTSLALAQGGDPGAAGGGLAERIAALKQSLAQSQQSLRTYQWIETTVVSLKGDVKSTKQSSCFYGADGVLTKVAIAASPPPAPKRGLRGAIVASKTEELTDTMKQAVALVKTYVPPDPALIQRSKDTGKASMEILQPGKLIRLVFRDYQLPGDQLAVTVDLTSNRLTAISVATYLGQPSAPITLDVQMGSLADGTTYAANIQLVAKAQQLSVAITNSGYTKKVN
jgi:hypothetical protein